MMNTTRIDSADGQVIRRARKDWNCDALYGWPDLKRCNKPIPRGSLYVQGEIDPSYAGGFGHRRICLECAGMPAREVAERGQ